MDMKELEQAAFSAMQEAGPLAAAELFYRQYEQTVAAIRKARESQDSSLGTKAVLEQLTVSDEDNDAAREALMQIREVVFNTLSEQPHTSILLYEALRDYASNEVKDFRDDVIRQAKRELDVPEEDGEEVELPDVSTDELKELREKTEAFWTVAGKPEMKAPADKDKEEGEVYAETKTLKDGSLKLAFSNLPKNLEGKEDNGGENTDKSVKHSRLRYKVDGTLVAPNTPLSHVGLWYISSPDWTVSVEEIKRAVEQAYDEKYAKVGDYEVKVNGHTLERYRENI